MSHFDAVGFVVEDESGFGRVLDLAVSTGLRTDLAGGRSFHELTDASGAGVEVVLRGNDIECAKPTFRGSPGAEVVLGGWAPDDDCEWCTALWVDVVADGSPAYPAVVELVGLPLVRGSVRAETAAPASFALFVEEVGDPDGGGPELARRAAIPVGTFGPTPAARMLVSGDVLATERRVNGVTGTAFGWARVASYGAEYDVLLPEPPPVGERFQGVGWLLAHLDLPVPGRRRWWRHA